MLNSFGKITHFFASFVFETTATKPKEKKQHHVSSFSTLSSLSTGFILHTFSCLFHRIPSVWAQKTTGGRVGGKSKGTSSLSSSLFLSSSFFFPPSYFALHTPTSAPGTGYILQRIYLSHSVLLSTSTSPLCRLNGVESRLCFGCTREVGKHERRVRFVREVSVYFEGKYQTSIFNLYNLVLTYCAPVLKSAIIFIGKFNR